MYSVYTYVHSLAMLILAIDLHYHHSYFTASSHSDAHGSRSSLFVYSEASEGCLLFVGVGEETPLATYFTWLTIHPPYLICLFPLTEPLLHEEHEFLLALVGNLHVFDEPVELKVSVVREQERLSRLRQELDEIAVMSR